MGEWVHLLLGSPGLEESGIKSVLAGPPTSSWSPSHCSWRAGSCSSSALRLPTSLSSWTTRIWRQQSDSRELGAECLKWHVKLYRASPLVVPSLEEESAGAYTNSMGLLELKELCRCMNYLTRTIKSVYRVKKIQKKNLPYSCFPAGTLPPSVVSSIPLSSHFYLVPANFIFL